MISCHTQIIKNQVIIGTPSDRKWNLIYENTGEQSEDMPIYEDAEEQAEDRTFYDNAEEQQEDWSFYDNIEEQPGEDRPIVNGI